MKKFIYTSPGFAGEIEFQFNDFGLLTLFEIRAELSESQQAVILKYMPHSEQDLPVFQAKGTGQLQLIVEQVTFDMFWNKYAKKVNRLRAEKLWDRLKLGDQSRAFRSIDSYDRCIDRTRRIKQDPDTYLRNRSFETNWNQI